MDYLRVYSVDFPYVEGRLHDQNSVMCLLFSGLEKRESVALTFSLTRLGEKVVAVPKIKATTIQPHDTEGLVEPDLP